MKKIRDKLPLIGAAFLLIITLVNFTSNNNLFTGIVSVSLFLIIIILYFISKKQENHSTK
ncbi:hypothetical protein HMPREF3291_03465 [Bacillus sp. HMSC76G11]|nr:hypothetical protein HMPREF3291_03465 [Bacillus sp. HMSC76G11]